MVSNDLTLDKHYEYIKEICVGRSKGTSVCQTKTASTVKKGAAKQSRGLSDSENYAITIVKH